jgi:hypothetical protein
MNQTANEIFETSKFLFAVLIAIGFFLLFEGPQAILRAGLKWLKRKVKR